MWLLGGFRVTVGERTVGEGAWPLRKAASLVKLLALAPGHRLHREQIMELLWPDLGKRAASNNLRRVLHAARRVLDPTPDTPDRYLSLRNEQLYLCPEGQLWVDVEVFEEAAASARRARDLASYRAAIELYAGDLLPGDRYEEWAENRREGLRRLRLALLIELSGLYEEREEHGAAIESLRTVLAEEPTNEEAHAGLMRLYELSGRRREALAQYERLREVLSAQLGSEPSVATRRLRDEIAAGGLPPTRPTDGPRHEPPDPGKHNLPAPRTTFVGRDREITEVKRRLAMTRLLTITGAGGSGKTRLALEVVRDLVGTYRDGVWLVELAPISEEALVLQAVAQATGVREQPGRPLANTLTEALRERETLLLVDNCEHLADSVAHLLDALLDSCPRLQVLVTSREALNLTGETVWWVSPLSVPDGDHKSEVRDLAHYEAVRLFVERARLKISDFQLTLGNAGAVAEICRRLDGIPLAIELAAARVTALDIDQLAERLEDSLRLLVTGNRTASPRQRTLRGTLDWSYDLLSEGEKTLFGRLSIFAGGWTLQAAEAVGPGDGIAREDVLDLITRLVYKSLVMAEAPSEGQLRYRMLVPVRQYARERLEGSGETQAVLERHAAFFLALAEEAEPHLTGPDQAAWLSRLEAEHDNLRAARRWLHANRRQKTRLRLAGALWRFWYTRGHLQEGQQWLAEALSGSDDGASLARSRALNGAGALAWQRGDPEQAESYFERSLTVERDLGNKAGIARALNNLAIVANSRGDYGRAQELLEQSLAFDRELGDPRGVAYSLGELGHMALFQGQVEQAARYLEETLAIHQQLGDKRSVALTLNNLGTVARRKGDPQGATRLYRRSLDLVREIDDEWLTVGVLLEVGCSLAEQDRTEQAALILGAADGSRQEIGFELEPHALADYESALERVRANLGEETLGEVWNQARALSLEEAVEYALSEQDLQRRSTPTKTPTPRANLLTRREGEVAELVARGLTNRQIASELSISEHTAATHVARLLKKLGLNSRTQLSSWVIQQRLG